MDHGKTKHRNTLVITSRQKDRQKKKQNTSTNYRLTTSTTLTHHSVNTVLSLKRLTIELPHKDTLL